MKLTIEKIKTHPELSGFWKEACHDSDDAKNLDRAILRVYPGLKEFTRPLMNLEILSFTDPKELIKGTKEDIRKIRNELSRCNAVKVTSVNVTTGTRLREFFYLPEFSLNTQ
jgi:hypothetical protein